MFCVVEIGFTVFGIVMLIMLMVNGSFPAGKNKELRGGPAYIVALLMTAVFPLALLIACGLAAYWAKHGGPVDEDDPKLLLLDIGVVALSGVPAGIIVSVAAKPKKRKKKKRRRRDDD